MDLELREYPHCFALTGKDTIYFRDKLPKNGKKKPCYLKNVGWVYDKTPENKQLLTDLIFYLKGTFQKHEKPPLDKRYGILAWDVPYTEPKWLIDIVGTGWNPRINPSKGSDGIWLFHKCGISTFTATKACTFLRSKKKDGKLCWENLFTKQLVVNDNGTLPNSWDEFLQGPCTSAPCAWSRHARFVFKEGKELFFYDPWMQNVHKSKKYHQLVGQLEQKGYRSTFVIRKPEQTYEGSCNVIAFMRAILMAEYGKEGATMEVPDDYAVLAARLISKFR